MACDISNRTANGPRFKRDGAVDRGAEPWIHNESSDGGKVRARGTDQVVAGASEPGGEREPEDVPYHARELNGTKAALADMFLWANNCYKSTVPHSDSPAVPFVLASAHEVDNGIDFLLLELIAIGASGVVDNPRGAACRNQA